MHLGLIHIIFISVIVLTPPESRSDDTLDESQYFDTSEDIGPKSNSSIDRKQLNSGSSKKKTRRGKSVRAWQELSQHERTTVKNGRVNDGDRITAYWVSGLVGFGLGHAVAREYETIGWAFTIVDIGASATFTLGASQINDGNSNDSTLLYVGVGMLVASRTWQVIDVSSRIKQKNNDYDKVKSKLSFYVKPNSELGFALTF